MQLTHSYQSLPALFYAQALPQVPSNPSIVIYNYKLAEALEIQLNDKQVIDFLSGAKLPSSTKPIAQAYAGHQFGHFNMLGDGRAILLGELQTLNGLVDIQLKGAGPTNYSRRGDGQMALSSALREYIYSEAMHALGINTTRSLAVVQTGANVYRQAIEKGAVLTRIAHSHIRFGTFEYAAKFGNLQDLVALLNYTIQRHYPTLLEAPNRAVALLKSVIDAHMHLVVDWLRVGFIHGVLNTDNMSICAQTIDYGPCAFMNAYDEATVYSQIDTEGRYAFGQQAPIVHWNLTRFAETLLPLMHEQTSEAITIATDCLDKANDIFKVAYINMLHAKLGITKAQDNLLPIAYSLLNWMQQHKADYTNTFLHLMGKETLQDELYDTDHWQIIIGMWQDTLQQLQISKTDALAVMQKNNPNYIPRNKNIDALINDAVLTNSSDAIEYFLAKMQETYAMSITDKALTAPLPEHGFSTHCNT
jgi:serine/tyrosine/threonine adenylyltransferase